MQQAHDFLEEAATLAGLLENQSENVFDTVTLFKSWTINDVIGHLYMFDVAALKTLESGQAFDTFFAPISAGLNQGKTLLETQYPFLGDLRGRALFDTWLENTEILGEAYALADPKLRVKWAGPDMSALSSITARQMETWAHGHEVFDCLGKSRVETDRIENIVILGVNTFGWSHKVQGLGVPEQRPYLKLTAPSGQIWEYGDIDLQNAVIGSAVSFAQVVTQTRNVADTDLKMTGYIAQRWMETAQCFAGGKELPPAQGARSVQQG